MKTYVIALRNLVPVATQRAIAAAGLAVLTCSALLPAAYAQPVYRIIGPDGRVTYSDKPPPAVTAGKASPAPSTQAGGTSASPLDGLPFELRQIASRFPVTIYTGQACVPCASGRALLNGRGVPFIEKTVTTAEDVQALVRLTGESGLPVATIGSQQLKGFSDTEWSQYLDAAGYPKTSLLPAGYRAPPATPLVVISPVRDTAAQGPATASVPQQPRTAPPPAPAEANPSGIRF
ncbi:MAG: glutaredoxin family protein [Pseudomonadota bacterium]